MFFLPISLLVPAPYNPRRQREPDETLVESIKTHGVLEPLVVRPLGDGRYEIMAGERRYRAALKAGLAEVPAVIREAEDDEAFAIAVTENAARKDLDALEVLEAVLSRLRGSEDPEKVFLRGLAHLKRGRDTPASRALKEVARLLGISPYSLLNYRSLLKIPAEIRREIKGRGIPLATLQRVATNPEAVKRLQDALEEWRNGGAPPVPGLTPEESLWSTFKLHVAPFLGKERSQKARPLNRVEKLIWYLTDLVESLRKEGILTERMADLLEEFLDEAEAALLEADVQLTGVPQEAEFYYRAPREKLAATRKLLETARKRGKSGGGNDREEELNSR